MRESDPGVPEALPRTVRMLVDRLGAAAVDRLWLFPPLRRGRKEWGLVVASAFDDDETRRRMHTARYVAERTGEGLSYEPDLAEEATLPPERFSRVLDGVARRAEEDLGDPRSVEVEGDPDRIRALLEELEPADMETWQQ